MEFLKNCFKSLYDFSVYRELRTSSGFKTFLYVVMLSGILGMVAYMPFHKNVKSNIEIIENNADKIPEFTIKNNSLSLKNSKPVIIKDNGIVLIFDGRSDTNDEYAKADTAILWGKSGRRKRIKGKETGILKYADAKGMPINKKYVLEEAESYKYEPLKFVFQSIAVAYMLTLMSSLVIMIFNYNSENRMNFKEIFKISSFAVTLPIIIFAGLSLFGISKIMIISWLLVVVQILYVHKAIKVIQEGNSNKAADKKKKSK